jgi:undecaprenyl-diphosphatase
MNKNFFLAIVCFTSFILLSFIVNNKSNNLYFDKIINVDISLFIAINDFHIKLPAEVDQFMIVITLYGREIFLPFVLLLIFIFGGKNGRKTVIITGISILILIPTVSITKDYIERPRPFIPGFDPLMSADTNYSFPSGHSTLIVAGSITPLILFKGNKYIKILLIVLVIDAGLVSFSRIYVGVHYPFDVLGGFFLGSGISLFIICLINNIPKIRTIISTYKFKNFE